MPRPKREKPSKPDTVTRTQTFAGVIRKGPDGQKKLVVKSQRWYQYQINKFKDGEQVTLEVHNRKPKRTLAQNAYYWGVYLPKVAEETGEKDLDRLHELFKGKFLTQGVVEVLGEKVRMKKSTTELSIGDFTEYIMAIETDTGVKAPPTENYDLPPLRDSEDQELSTDT
jgi:hypothetical protein